MNIILLSGGSGKRLWPLSNEIRSKQFIRIFRGPDGNYESMLQRVYRQIKEVDDEARITIATSSEQVSGIYNQLGKVNISVEPNRRDTFPAVALAAVYLHEMQGVLQDEAVIVCPVDPFVDNSYFLALKDLESLVCEEKERLSLIGIQPTYPSEKYGYIIPLRQDKVSKVSAFKEKPDVTMAKRYIGQGALWNAGVFACRLEYLLEKAHAQIAFTDYWDLRQKYSKLDRISLDYAVAEKEQSIQVLRYAGTWLDLGTWNTFIEPMEQPCMGKVVLDDTCESVHVINELNIPVLCLGVKDAIVVANSQGILVSDKRQSSYIKPYVEELKQPVMFAEKSWGEFQIIDISEESTTVKVMLMPGHGMKYHSHKHRTETWNVIRGTGTAILDGIEHIAEAGSVIQIPIGCRHTIKAETELQIIEVQHGKDINVDDKEVFD